MTHLAQQIAPLKSWEDFEDLCCALFQKEWGAAQKHGRYGQAQQGVDVFGQNRHDGNQWYGVACKGKNNQFNTKLTKREIDEELMQADHFTPRLAHWIIVTTTPVDTKLQEYAHQLTMQRQVVGLCPVTVFCWEDIEALLRKHLDVTRSFFPDHLVQFDSAANFYIPQAAQLNDYFSDPMNHLQTLRQQLVTHGQTALLAKVNVQGMGGVGKTQLALKYCHDFKTAYAGVWWFGAETQSGLEADCLLFCEKQGIAMVLNEAPGSAVRNWLAGRENWLLVYDQAEDVKMVRQFLPQIGKHHVLLTSRNPHWDGMQSLALGVWSDAQGLEFLQTRLGDGFAKDEELRALSKAIDGLPLALEQACAYMLTRKIPVVKYLAALAKQEATMLQRQDASACPRSVFATLSLAFDQLSAAAQALLKLCSWLEAEPIPCYLFTEQPAKLPEALQAVVRDEIQWHDTLAELEQYALCRLTSIVLLDHVGNGDEEVACLSFHRLTLAAARVGGSARESMAILDLPDTPKEPKNWPRCKLLLPHIMYMAECYQEQWGEELHLARLLNQLAIYLQFGPAQYQAALPLFQRALEIAEKKPEAEHSVTATYLNNLALLHQSTGGYDAALPLLLRALAIAEKTHGPGHPEAGTSLNNLGILYESIGDYDAALVLYQRAVAIAEETQGPDHPDTGSRLNNLAAVYYAAGEFDKALPLVKHALAITEKTLGSEHPEMGISLNNLAQLNYAMGDYDSALPLYQRALAIAEHSFGVEHPYTIARLNNLAELYRATGNYDAALPIFKRALAVAEKTQGPEHPDTGTCLNNLAGLYESTGDYDAALPLNQRALAIAEKVQGPDHPVTGTRLNNLAELYRATGDYDAALPLYQRALLIAEKALGPEHPETGTSLNNLALLYKTMGDYEAALPLYQRALSLVEKALGPVHPAKLASLNNLASLHYVMGNFEQAQSLLQDVLTRGEELLGKAHPNTALFRENLSKLNQVMSQVV